MIDDLLQSASLDEINAFLDDFHSLMIKHASPPGKVKVVPFMINALITTAINCVDESDRPQFILDLARHAINNLDAQILERSH